MYVNEYKLRYNRTQAESLCLKNSKQIFDFLYNNVYDHDEINIFESIYVVLLSAANEVKGFAKIGQGGVSSTLADIRLISKYAIESLASAIVITHNHPSGNTKPSKKDEILTKDVKKAMDIFGIVLLDHVIISDRGYFSFIDSGLL